MEYALSVTMAIFAIIGAIDKITGNHLKLGDEFEKGIHTIAPLTMSMLGMITIAPTLSDILLPVVKPVAGLLKFDPSAIAGIIFANDMGGAALADSVCNDALLGSFHGLVVASMLGATISFTIPVSISSINKEFTRAKTKMLIAITKNINVVPHLSCKRVHFLTFSTVKSSPFS